MTNKINHHSYDTDFLLNKHICICTSEFVIPSNELGKLYIYSTDAFFALFWKVSVCIRHRARSEQKRKLIFAYINFLKSVKCSYSIYLIIFLKQHCSKDLGNAFLNLFFLAMLQGIWDATRHVGS